MKRYLVTPEASWAIESSMFVVEGSWETGYLLNKDLLRALGLEEESYTLVGAFHNRVKSVRSISYYVGKEWIGSHCGIHDDFSTLKGRVSAQDFWADIVVNKKILTMQVKYH